MGKPNIYFLTYADDRFGRKGGRYRENQIAVARLMLTHPDIADVFSFTQEDLIGTEFYQKAQRFIREGINTRFRKYAKAVFRT